MRVAKIADEIRRTTARGETRHARVDEALTDLTGRVAALEAALAEHAADKKGHK